MLELEIEFTNSAEWNKLCQDQQQDQLRTTTIEGTGRERDSSRISP